VLLDRVVISGVGQSVVGRTRPESMEALAIESIRAAIADAGLGLRDIDGLATFPGMAPEIYPGFVGPDLYLIQDSLGLDLDWHGAAFQGPGQFAPVINAIGAVTCGLCNHAVVFRTMKEGSGRRAAAAGNSTGGGSDLSGEWHWLQRAGAYSAPNWAALYAQRYFHETGTSREDLGHLVVKARANARANPSAIMREELSLDAYLNARMISDPISVLDCDVPIDGSSAVVISRADAANGLRHPVALAGLGTALHGRPYWELRQDLLTMAAHDAARQMWNGTSLLPADIDFYQIYDGISIFALLWMEALGIAERGGAAEVICKPDTVLWDGPLPINTWGGQLSGGRLHGLGFLVECVRQLRGEAEGRQVARHEVGVATVGGGPIAGCMLLTTLRQ
jgi:acetyl-CoA acetyltransferase